jgi:hypothetical protein
MRKRTPAPGGERPWLRVGSLQRKAMDGLLTVAAAVRGLAWLAAGYDGITVDIIQRIRHRAR